jgi:hypothetical protein
MENPRFPHTAVIRRITQSDPFASNPGEQIVYEGVCRSYTKQTTNDRGEVLTSSRILAIPVKRDEWANMPVEGDYIEVSIRDIIEYGHVIDKSPNNFGTDILWKYGRN